MGSRVVQIYTVKDETILPEDISPEALNKKADISPVRCLDKKAEKRMIEVIDKAKKEGDSVGGIFEVVASGLPYGLGSYVQWDTKLHARIAESIMSVNAFKGIEIGIGFESGHQLGSEVHDEIGWDGGKIYPLFQ